VLGCHSHHVISYDRSVGAIDGRKLKFAICSELHYRTQDMIMPRVNDKVREVFERNLDEMQIVDTWHNEDLPD
jgi:hypothetical protein